MYRAMSYNVHCLKLRCIKLQQSYDTTELQYSEVAIQENCSLMYIVFSYHEVFVIVWDI